MRYAMFADIGSTFTKVTAADLDAGTIVGRAMSPTTVQDDVCRGFDNAVNEIFKQAGPIEPEFTLACSSAAGGLKMVACGLVPDLTAEAARLASLSAGAKVLASYAYKLSHDEVRELDGLKPEIVMLSGGTDGGNAETVLHNAARLAEAQTPFTVIVAGNKTATEECCEILSRSGKHAVPCPNVMPEFGVLRIDPAREAVRKVFLDRIVKAKGLDKLVGRVDGDIIPTPSAILDAMLLLSHGVGEEPGIGSLMAFDIGGATTDVYTVTEGCPIYPGAVLKGLPHPAEKRTVEGDLGMRWNARTIVSHYDTAQFAKLAGVTERQVEDTLDLFDRAPETLPGDDPVRLKIDAALAKCAVRLAATRHAGHIETVFTPLGEQYMQTGKDLSDVSYLIGTGGPIICSPDPDALLSQANWTQETPFDLLPRKARPLVDRLYMLSAMGLLAQRMPDVALRMMKKQIVGE